MVRKYENEINKENRDSYINKKRHINNYLSILIFSLVLAAFSGFILIAISKQRTSLFFLFLFPIFTFSILIFIFSLIGLIKKRLNKWCAFTHLGLSVLVLAFAISHISSLVASFSYEDKGKYYNSYMSEYVLLDSIRSDNYQKLLKKEAQPKKDKIEEIDNELLTWRTQKDIDYILQKSSPTEEEQQIIDEFMVFLNGTKPFVTDYVNRSICLIVDDKKAFTKYVNGYYDFNDFFTHLYTVDEFLASDAELLNLRPFVFHECGHSNCYEGEVYINFTADYLENFGACLTKERSDNEYISSFLERKGLYFTEGLSNYNQEVVLMNFLENFCWETRTEHFKQLREKSLSYVDENDDVCEHAKKYPTSKSYYKKTIESERNSKIFQNLFVIFGFVSGASSIASMILLIVSYQKTILYRSLKDLDYQAKYIGTNIDYVYKVIIKEDLNKAVEDANKIQEAYIAKRKEDIANSKEFIKELNLSKDSYFDGMTIQVIGWKMLGTLISIVTLGILYPLKVAWVQGWKINHRYINGKKLSFNGNGFQLLGKYILWWLLSIITLGIYLIFLPKKIEQWVTYHTHFVNLEEVDEKTKKLFTNNGITNESKFNGGVLQLLGWNILGFLITLFTLGILYPVSVSFKQRWRINHQNINGLDMRFDGNGFQLLGRYLLWWLLSIITIGIYLIFIPVRMEKWISKHIHFKKVEVDEEI